MRPKSIYLPTDIVKAKKRCATVLGKRQYHLPELMKTCVISVLIPAYGESVERIRGQIQAFARQAFPMDQYELVYVVNNDIADWALSRMEVIQKNAQLLQFLRKKQPLSVRVIDASSAGHEILDCTVGKARQLGLHAVAQRYLAQDRDGIIIHTDADTYPVKKSYLKTVWKEMKLNRHIGAAGGLEMVLDLDTSNAKERAFFRKHIGTLRDYSMWIHLVMSLHTKDLTPPVSPVRFSGAHMVSKAIASVCAGGFSPLARAEDVMFGEALLAYAERIGGKILPRRDVWILRTAIRESTRTGISFGPIFANIKEHDGQPLVRHPHSLSYHEFVPQFLSELQKNKNHEDKWNQLLGSLKSADHPAAISALKKLLNQLKGKRTPAAYMQKFGVWRLQYPTSPALSLIQEAYQAAYPLIPLTKRGLLALKKEVFKDPARKAYVLNAVKYFSQYTLPRAS